MALNVGDAYIQLMLDRTPLTRAMQQGQSDVTAWGNHVEKTVSGAGSSFGKLGQVMQGVFMGVGMAAATKGLELVSAGLGQVKRSMIDTNAQLQDSNTAWKTLLGTQEQATAQMKALKDFANTTPFEFGEVDKSAKTMATFGIAVGDTTKYLKLFGDAASGTNQGMEDVTFWSSRMYDAIKSGKPFGEAAARLQEMGVISGVTRTKLEEMQAQGKSGDEVWAAYSASLGRFSGLMDEQSKNWHGLTSTIGDSVNFLIATASKPIFDKLSLGAGKLVEILGSDKINTFAETMGTTVANSLDTAFNSIGKMVDGGRHMVDVFKTTSTAASDLVASFSSGDFSAAFGPILSAIDTAFGDDARNKSVKFVSSLLSGFQSVRDTVITVKEAWSGNWQDSDKISSPFVKAAGNITQVFRDSLITARQAWSGDWQDSDTISNPFVRGIGIGVKAISDGITTAKDVIGGLRDTIGEVIGSFKTDGAAGAAGSIAGILFGPAGSQAVTDAITTITGKIDTIKSAFNFSGAAGAGALVSAILGPDVGQKASEMFSTLADQVGPLFDTVKSFDYSGFFSDMAAGAGDLATQLAPVAESAKNLYLAFAPMGAIIGPLTGQFNVWASLAQTLGPILQNTLGAALIGIQGALTPLGDLFSQLGAVVSTQGPAMAQIGGSLMDLWSALAPVFQTVAGVIGTILVGAIGLLVSNIGALIGFLTGALPGALQALNGAIQVTTGVIRFFSDLFGGTIRVIGDLIHGDFSGALKDMTGMGNALRSDLGAIWTGLKDTVLGVFNALVGGLTGAAEGFVNVFTGYFTSIYNRVTGETMPAFKLSIQTTFSELVSNVTTAVGNWFSDLGTKFDGFRDRAVTTFTDFRDKAKSLILAPFEGARDAIGGIMEAFRSALVGPLNAGLSSMGKFGGGVRDVINWIARALHIPEIPGAPAVPMLAKGTGDFQGGPAIVGEKGPELVFMPRHAIVVPNHLSEQLIASGMVPGFADGLNLPSLFDMIKGGPQWLLDKAISSVGLVAPQLPGVLSSGGAAFFVAVKKWMADAVIGFVKQALPVSGDQVQDMINFAESQIGLPYIWGGGHGGGLGGPGVGFDCSGFVAAVLNKGGIKNPGGIVTDFYNWMRKDGGNGVVDIGINSPFAAPDVQHTGIRLLGTTYESGGPFGGVGKNGTAFAEWGSPPDVPQKALGGLTGGVDNVDWFRSLQNMKRGVRGQWTALAGGGVLDEKVIGIGAESGTRYMMGEAGREFVIPENLLPKVAAYFAEVAATGEISNKALVGIPLEMRDALKRIATKYLASLVVNNIGSLMPDMLGGNVAIPDYKGDSTGVFRVPETPEIRPSGGGFGRGGASSARADASDPFSPDYTGPPGTGTKSTASGTPIGDALITQIAGDVRTIRDVLTASKADQVGPVGIPGTETDGGAVAIAAGAEPETIANPNRYGPRGGTDSIPNPNDPYRPMTLDLPSAPVVIATESRIVLEMPDGTEIVKVIRSQDVALRALSEGVTLVQAEEMRALTQ